MKTFTILIDEPQRAALLEILTGADPEEHSEALGDWPEMLKALWAAEDEAPGSVHGFCL